MTLPSWPLFELRLTTPRLELRPTTVEDLARLVSCYPDDVEIDPSLPRHVLDPGAARAVGLLQHYWRSLSEWNAERWRLCLTVRADGDPVGMQDLKAERFAVRRMVASSSWLATSHRGRGLGKEMRAAVLALAFDGLGARAAETESWHDNLAALGVSRALGYEPNGIHVEVRDGRAEDMVGLRLTSDRWRSARPHDVRITGLDGCRAFFGLADTGQSVRPSATGDGGAPPR